MINMFTIETGISCSPGIYRRTQSTLRRLLQAPDSHEENIERICVNVTLTTRVCLYVSVLIPQRQKHE